MREAMTDDEGAGDADAAAHDDIDVKELKLERVEAWKCRTVKMQKCEHFKMKKYEDMYVKKIEDKTMQKCESMTEWKCMWSMLRGAYWLSAAGTK